MFIYIVVFLDFYVIYQIRSKINQWMQEGFYVLHRFTAFGSLSHSRIKIDTGIVYSNLLINQRRGQSSIGRLDILCHICCLVEWQNILLSLSEHNKRANIESIGHAYRGSLLQYMDLLFTEALTQNVNFINSLG